MNQTLLDKIITCPRLPSLPTIAMEVIELCRQDDTDIKQIADTISNDPALSSKILKTVNSSYYGLGQSVSTISHAIVILGLGSIKTLALGFSLVGTYKDVKSDGFDMMRFWQRSLYSAVGARTIAVHLKISEHEEAFLCGLLQNIGMVAMSQAIGEQYNQVVAGNTGQHSQLWQAEREAFDLDHMNVVGGLAEKWKLPPILSNPIEYHHLPAKALDVSRKLTQCIESGCRSASVFLSGDSGTIDDYFSALNKYFQVDHDLGESLLNSIKQSTGEMATLFDITTDSVPDVQHILAEANETLQELSLESQGKAHQLAQRNEKLKQQITLDPMTGLANRGRFNEFIQEQFEASAKTKQSLSVIFIDADKFKSINDIHGHQAGDAVLISLANILSSQCPGNSLVARYGGEEFVMVLPSHSIVQAAQLAESIRKTIENTTIDVDENLKLNITVSSGVSSFNGSDVFKRPEQLVDAADKAVYAAKSSGRNCVRVFAPKPKKNANSAA